MNTSATDTVEVRKEIYNRPCYCPRDSWGSRRCGHTYGIPETVWVVVVNGHPMDETYSRKRDAVAAATARQ